MYWVKIAFPTQNKTKQNKTLNSIKIRHHPNRNFPRSVDASCDVGKRLPKSNVPPTFQHSSESSWSWCTRYYSCKTPSYLVPGTWYLVFLVEINYRYSYQVLLVSFQRPRKSTGTCTWTVTGTVLGPGTRRLCSGVGERRGFGRPNFALFSFFLFCSSRRS